MQERLVETWQLTKPAVAGDAGMVSSQHYLASGVGARVLADGGNAVDAAVATGLAIGTVEPWMSGLGGGGYMVVYVAAEDRAYTVQFGMRAPIGIDPADYALVPGTDPDLFAWPSVVGDRNVKGPGSVAVPGAVAGYAAALERFGSWSWSDVIAPARRLAREGMLVDWYATLKIATAAPDLARHPASRAVYLPEGFVPAGGWNGPIPRLILGGLADTLDHLDAAGPEDFYRGALAGRIVDDARACDIALGPEDLERYAASVVPCTPASYRGARVDYARGLTAGPTLAEALASLETSLDPSGPVPGPDAYASYAASLDAAYRRRLAEDGDSREAPGATSCTTHVSVVDRDGNMVSLTQTLLSLFGSKVVLPETGILMNNGIMWFDPRPGGPNSIAAGKQGLCNMCPTIVRRGDGRRFALGASGGRRIMPAVFQLTSFLVDYRMELGAAAHRPRLDVSGSDLTTLDAALDADVVSRLQRERRCEVEERGVYPAYFACPNVVAHDPARGQSEGVAFIPSPWAQACPEPAR